jgi:hypothetical protein
MLKDILGMTTDISDVSNEGAGQVLEPRGSCHVFLTATPRLTLIQQGTCQTRFWALKIYSESMATADTDISGATGAIIQEFGYIKFPKQVMADGDS